MLDIDLTANTDMPSACATMFTNRSAIPKRCFAAAEEVGEEEAAAAVATAAAPGRGR